MVSTRARSRASAFLARRQRAAYSIQRAWRRRRQQQQYNNKLLSLYRRHRLKVRYVQRAWRNRAAERLGRRHLQKVRYVQRAWRYRASELPCPFTTHEATMVAYHLGYIPYDIDSYVPPPYCYLPGNLLQACKYYLNE